MDDSKVIQRVIEEIERRLLHVDEMSHLAAPISTHYIDGVERGFQDSLDILNRVQESKGKVLLAFEVMADHIASFLDAMATSSVFLPGMTGSVSAYMTVYTLLQERKEEICVSPMEEA